MSVYKIEAGTGQHIGDRSEQQDRVALYTAPKAPGYVMAVLADGMGGLSGGAMAAEQVLRTAKQAFELFSPLTEKVPQLLESIARDAHTLIKLAAFSSEKNPHSTMVVLVLTPEREAFWAHVGDSRLYRFDGPNCVHRTRDHSYVDLLVRQGKLAAQDAPSHPMSNVLLSALGTQDSELEVTLGHHKELKAGDAFLLCSDGLWHYFNEAELGAALAMNAPRQASEMLLGKARERATDGNGDNCSLAIVKLAKPESAAKTTAASGLKRAV
ncbi:MAG TPA: protein phosphatase 2C domain-containing protein [Noviherbaspirillum sp.]